VRNLTTPAEQDEDAAVRDVTLDEDGQPIGIPGGRAAQLELSPEAGQLEFEKSSVRRAPWRRTIRRQLPK
jgi:flagellar M-ring protein FliF